MTRDGVMRFMRKTMRRAGWRESRVMRYGTHSCRIGGCTALFQLGATPEVIKNMGGVVIRRLQGVFETTAGALAPFLETDVYYKDSTRRGCVATNGVNVAAREHGRGT